MLKEIMSTLLYLVVGLALGYGLKLTYDYFTQTPPMEVGDYSQILSEADSKVVMFGTDWCQFCKGAREFFDSNKVAYKDYDVEKSDEAKQLYQPFASSGVPVIIIGDTKINGFNQPLIEETLIKEGLLATAQVASEVQTLH